jgi:hypothetical protein
MKRWVIFGLGTTMIVEAPCPEHAEAIVCEQFGVDVGVLVTVPFESVWPSHV